MVGRRMGLVAMSVVLVGSVASCGRTPDRVASGAHDGVPDTVALPDMLAALSTPTSASTAIVSAPPMLASAPAQPAAAAGPEQALVMVAMAGPARPAVAPVGDGLRHATIDFTGDTLIHSPLVNQAHSFANGEGYDFSPMFSRVAPILASADLAVCHLESAIAPWGEPLSTFPVYGVPAEIADGLASAGYDRCSTASNHTIDRGTGGIDATVDALERAGLSQAGMARTPEEAVATLVDANGITVAHLSYTFGFNGFRLPAGEPWRSNLIDVPRIVADAVDARARGAQFVVVNLHWGAEGSSDVTPYQREVADAITRSGTVDLIVGEHAHVIQPIEQVNGTWVVFGMGNFLSNMPTGTFPPKTQDGMIVSVSIDEQADGTFAVERPIVIPTWVDRRDGFLIRPVVADLADAGVSDATKAALGESLQRTGAVVGAFIPG